MFVVTLGCCISDPISLWTKKTGINQSLEIANRYRICATWPSYMAAKQGSLATLPVGTKEHAVKYTNPVWDGYFADPFVLKRGNQYFAYGTAEQQANGRWFPVLRSTDLVHWTPLGGVLEPLADSVKYSSYWAPEVVENDGHFFLYYSAGGPSGEHQQLRVAIADKPEGPFLDEGKVLIPDEPFSIDGHPFQDPKTGRWYLFFAKDYFDGRVGTGIAMIELGADMKSVIGYPRAVVRPHFDWQIAERQKFCYNRTWEEWHRCEGPSVIYHYGRYYCLYTGGRPNSPTYGVGFAVADSIFGPWADKADTEGPSVLAAVPGKVLGPGHSSVTVLPNGFSQVAVYHAWNATYTACKLCVDPLTWKGINPHCQPTYEECVLDCE